MSIRGYEIDVSWASPDSSPFHHRPHEEDPREHPEADGHVGGVGQPGMVAAAGPGPDHRQPEKEDGVAAEEDSVGDGGVRQDPVEQEG